jgi:hypothetical protein
MGDRNCEAFNFPVGWWLAGRGGAGVAFRPSFLRAREVANSEFLAFVV